MKLDPYLTPFKKLTQNDQRPKYKGVNLYALGFGNEFLDMTLKA